jgi:thiamine pyrophosphokinase
MPAQGGRSSTNAGAHLVEGAPLLRLGRDARCELNDYQEPMRAIIVAGGQLDAADVRQLAAADLVVAADAGANALEAAGRRPDLVVGDLDSADPAVIARLQAVGVPIERHPADKEASDSELAVERAADLGATQIVVLGGLGGLRLDHEVANLLLVADRRWAGRDVRLVEGRTLVRALHAGAGITLAGCPGDLVTLLPLGGDAIGVTTSGLRWPLSGDTLRFGRTRGLSNEVATTPASVNLERGTLLVVETAKE